MVSCQGSTQGGTGSESSQDVHNNKCPKGSQWSTHGTGGLQKEGHDVSTLKKDWVILLQ